MRNQFVDLKKEYFDSVDITVKWVLIVNVYLIISIGLFLSAFLVFQTQSAHFYLKHYRELFIYFLWIVVVLIILRKRKLSLKQFFGQRDASLRNVVLASSVVLFLYFIKWSSRLYFGMKPSYESVYEFGSISSIIIHFLLAILIGPVIEEIIFRGFFYPPLRNRLGIIPALLISSAVFAVWHINIDVTLFIQISLLGLLFAYFFERSCSLVPSIILHSSVNFESYFWNGLDLLGLNNILRSISLGFLVLSLMLYLFYRQSRRLGRA